MIAVLFILIAVVLLVIILYPVIRIWLNVGIKQYEAMKLKESKVCTHSSTSRLAYFINDEGELQTYDCCNDCGKVLRVGEKSEQKERPVKAPK